MCKHVMGVVGGEREGGWRYVHIAKPGPIAKSVVSKGRGGQERTNAGGRGTEKAAAQDMWVTCSELHSKCWSLVLGLRPRGFKAFTLNLPHACQDFGIFHTKSVNVSRSTFLTSKICPSWMSLLCAQKTEQCRLYQVSFPTEHPSQILPRTDRVDMLYLFIKSPRDKQLDWGSSPPTQQK